MTEIIKINENTWRIEDGFVRFFLIEGSDKALLLDSGVNSQNAAEIIKEITDKPIMLLNTHGDMDHISGTGGFSKIHMHIEDYLGCDIKNKYPDVQFVKIEDGDMINLGNRMLQVIYIPGHTKGSIALLDLNNRILFAGDSVQKGNIFMFGNHRCKEMYKSSLEKLILLKDKYDVIYASHDEYALPDNYAEKVMEVWNLVCDKKIPYEIVELFGNKVKSYSTDICGFYIEG